MIDTMTVAPTGAASDSAHRFHVAVQKTRYWAYLLSFGAFFVGKALGAFPSTRSLHAAVMLLVAMVAVGLTHAVYRFRLDERVGFDPTPWWLATDILLACIAVWLTGGASSPWFIWYVGVPAAAAVSMGRVAARVASFTSFVSYLLTLYVIGDLRSIEDVYLATIKMFLLWAASFFPIEGVAKLQERRIQIQQLRQQDARKLEELTALNEELTRLAGELDRRTTELAVSNERLSEANTTIQEQDRLKSEFLASMSHELRTPLNAIIGFTEVLSTRLADRIEERERGFLRSILSSGRHLLGVINDILDLSKIEAGKMEFFPEPFDPIEPVNAVCELVGVSAQARSITVEIEAPGAMPLIETDLGKFKQILFNLLSNAIKFSADGGLVTVRIRPLATKELAVSVTDRGEGIAREDIDLIFQEFAQIVRVARTHGGTGLGLALVKQYVDKLGGRIEVESEPGAGSTFTFSLPLEYRV